MKVWRPERPSDWWAPESPRPGRRLRRPPAAALVVVAFVLVAVLAAAELCLVVR